MEFEFDPQKSQINLAKHKIDFITAQELWSDKQAIGIPLKTMREERWAVIGRINGKLWTAIVTYRGRTIRLISVRRARKEEEARYEARRLY